MNVRPIASPADLTIARTLFEEYGASLRVDLAFQDFATELATLPGAYAPPAGALLLAELQGEAVGCVALRPLEPPFVAELKRLYVRSAGRGLGLGTALSLAALEHARTAGYRRVRLDTLPGMTQAQALYRELGFYEIPAYRYNPVPGTVFMELDLSADRSIRRQAER